MNNQENIKLPWKYNNWLIWPNTLLNNLYATDCIDTTKGVCLKNKTLEECLKKCSNNCSVGYHIKLSNGNTICIPLDDTKYKTLSPYYLLQNQESVNLKNMIISTFVNTDIFPFPPKDKDSIFYTNKITIRDATDNSLYLNSDNSNIDKSKVVLNKNKLILNFLPVTTLDKNLTRYIPINYNQKLLLNIPNTDIILNNSSNYLIWDKILAIFSENNIIKLIPLDKKKYNTNVKLNDKFKIKYKNKYVKILSNNSLTLVDSTDSLFTIKPEEKGYYCDKNKCVQGNISDLLNKKGIITRSPNCFNLCGKKLNFSTKPPHRYKNLLWLYILISFIIIIIIIILIIYLK